MPEGGDEVEAAVHPVVDDVPPVQAALVVQVPLKLLVDVADDGFKAERHKYQPSRDTRGSTPDSQYPVPRLLSVRTSLTLLVMEYVSSSGDMATISWMPPVVWLPE